MRACRLFYGYWPDINGRGRTNLVVEQVSHHPPITAYYLSNESKGLHLNGPSAQKTSFSGVSPFWLLSFLPSPAPLPFSGRR